MERTYYEKMKLVEKIASEVLKEKEIFTGGCNPFYTPEEWRARGEEYGLNSELIICHDGGDYAYLCNTDHGFYELTDMFSQKLKEHGYFLEACTCWYSALYKD